MCKLCLLKKNKTTIGTFDDDERVRTEITIIWRPATYVVVQSHDIVKIVKYNL